MPSRSVCPFSVNHSIKSQILLDIVIGGKSNIREVFYGNRKEGHQVSVFFVSVRLVYGDLDRLAEKELTVIKLKLTLNWFCDGFLYLNGKDADRGDFGQMIDLKPIDPEPGCGNMVFFPKASTPVVLEKYGITQDEYKEITAWLEKKLDVGACNKCDENVECLSDK